MFSLLSILPFALAVYAQSDCARIYTVVTGDICDAISVVHNSSTYQLAAANPEINADCSNLFPGETLCLGLTGQDCTSTAVITSGDSCASIAATAGIADSTLLANNPNVNAECTNIYPNEVLCTASTVISYNTTSSA
ncbi:uncharacterized protein STEHIDRAFT_170450 [Stereum hirsutum FP-91666 SS1]|uniref:uncharacterized protein n=1 Tax=Stereum hirsutum (strain FP-91666) TaxID=721885 RepID=UPI0004449A0A|nr:uncharacterized protein STEHIDRAFT_170450 [Stereum hirsutum FP-91666 SS1]EIM84050.1 hypothetical protein STEHIDRAFT_170450 [Stereum hirsutum FP-91666 SS1]